LNKHWKQQKGKGKGKGHPTTGHKSPEGEYRYSSTLSLTSALDGVGDQRHAPAVLPQGKTRYPLYRRLGGSQGRSGQVRKISPTAGIRSPNFPARSESETAQTERSGHLLRIDKLERKEINPLGRKEVGVQSIVVKVLVQYQRKWLQHLERMETNRVPKLTLHYRPNGRGNIDRPKKRWKEC